MSAGANQQTADGSVLGSVMKTTNFTNDIVKSLIKQKQSTASPDACFYLEKQITSGFSTEMVWVFSLRLVFSAKAFSLSIMFSVEVVSSAQFH